ncbi:DeoR family transcriptional regulator [Paenibacillus sp. LMG 31460]|uniref:DeoR family transcriptional regulator n=1 Tax=Paenibacillus germinis TaxID=2654979 RepID=A0ABX1ZCF5_9BACL|nr:DeoR/GlpR family DNA-binding transcription regulator [Paenibacillus germinis]NOU90762.1 DeoR family transcriptional regulator [Paenibacillus germinis]
MNQDERTQAIIQYLKDNHKIQLEDICELYGVSRDTARRDLVKLEEEGDIIRVRGGAMLTTLTKDIKSYKERLLDSANKRSIGRMAASLIKDGDFILMDTATTIQFTAEYMSTKNNVVVTNSIDIASILCDKPHVTTHLLGGELNTWHRYVFGPRTLEMLADIKVDKLILSACGITSDGLTAPSVDEAYVKLEMIKRADQVIVLADSSKFRKSLFHRICDLGKINVLITDQEPDSKMREMLIHNEVELIVVPSENLNNSL